MAFTGQATAVNWCPTCQVEGGHHTYDCPNFTLVVAPLTKLQAGPAPIMQSTPYLHRAPPIFHDPHHPSDPSWSTASSTTKTMALVPMGFPACTSTGAPFVGRTSTPLQPAKSEWPVMPRCAHLPSSLNPQTCLNCRTAIPYLPMLALIGISYLPPYHHILSLKKTIVYISLVCYIIPHVHSILILPSYLSTCCMWFQIYLCSPISFHA